MYNNQKTPLADISWQDNQPYSNQFDDVYFSSDNGLLETQYVFLDANKLQSRWQSLTQAPFTIIETGFGTGLNFLAAVARWHASAPSHAQLHFISVEKYPMPAQTLKRALSAWPSLATLARQLFDAYATIDLSHYPQTVTLHPFNKITLTLHLNDATAALRSETKQADAWFLDGFSPAKNPDMWQADLFNSMASLSNQTTTFATFTSAGHVKRGLSQAGFQVTKQSGFGKKREMLLGRFGTHDD